MCYTPKTLSTYSNYSNVTACNLIYNNILLSVKRFIFIFFSLCLTLHTVKNPVNKETLDAFNMKTYFSLIMITLMFIVAADKYRIYKMFNIEMQQKHKNILSFWIIMMNNSFIRFVFLFIYLWNGECGWWCCNDVEEWNKYVGKMVKWDVNAPPAKKNRFQHDHLNIISLCLFFGFLFLFNFSLN